MRARRSCRRTAGRQSNRAAGGAGGPSHTSRQRLSLATAQPRPIRFRSHAPAGATAKSHRRPTLPIAYLTMTTRLHAGRAGALAPRYDARARARHSAGWLPPLLLAVAMLLCRDSAVAQDARVDSLAVQGRRDGVELANRRSMAGRAVLAFAGGSMAGFWGPFVPFIPASIPIGAAVGGLALSTVAATSGDFAVPEPAAQAISAKEALYQDAFRRAYAERIRSRRRRSALWSTAAGAATGFAALVVIINTGDF